MHLTAGDPGLRRRLLGLSLVWRFGVAQLANRIQRRLPAHPVLARLPEFLALALTCHETRLSRMGLLDRPLAELSPARKAALIAEAYAHKGAGGARALLQRLPLAGKKRLTETYLDDPTVRAAIEAAAE
jgi:hypothetical protein